MQRKDPDRGKDAFWKKVEAFKKESTKQETAPGQQPTRPTSLSVPSAGSSRPHGTSPQGSKFLSVSPGTEAKGFSRDKSRSPLKPPSPLSPIEGRPIAGPSNPRSARGSEAQWKWKEDTRGPERYKIPFVIPAASEAVLNPSSSSSGKVTTQLKSKKNTEVRDSVQGITKSKSADVTKQEWV